MNVEKNIFSPKIQKIKSRDKEAIMFNVCDCDVRGGL